MLTRRRALAASAAGFACAGTGLLPRARAQALKKPVHIIVGFPAGGGTDVIARILADRLRGPYASTVLVENKPGAAARIAVEYVKNAEPDGSVMLFTPDFPITSTRTASGRSTTTRCATSPRWRRRRSRC
jgi:tripartite-type tricarboxylate transporter receptor subunit TctC